MILVKERTFEFWRCANSYFIFLIAYTLITHRQNDRLYYTIRCFAMLHFAGHLLLVVSRERTYITPSAKERRQLCFLSVLSLTIYDFVDRSVFSCLSICTKHRNQLPGRGLLYWRRINGELRGRDMIRFCRSFTMAHILLMVSAVADSLHNSASPPLYTCTMQNRFMILYILLRFSFV